MKWFLSVWLVLFGGCTVRVTGQVVIPSPEKLVRKEGKFDLEKKRLVVYTEDTAAIHAEFFKKEIIGSLPFSWSARKSKATIRLVRNAAYGAEGYRLCVTPDYIEIQAGDEAGFIYSVQTLRQWREYGAGPGSAFRCVEITDAPRMKWRGFMLDSGRQYQSVATVKKYIDMVSLLKMNYFHWHLTEGLGWRVEIKQYPLLTGKGAYVGTGKEQQGFYSQEQIREIVDYAAKRCVTIVPEIDMPGHAEAALSAYPELGCFGQPVAVPQKGFTQHIFCAGKDRTLAFLKQVLDEVCTLFPSPYIHLGGDEAPKGNWDRCPDCRKRIADYHLKDSHDLQLWFSAQMADYLKTKGRKAIFWGDVVYQDGYVLPDNVVIQWWNYRGHKDLALRNALRHRYPVICSTNYYTYLNFPLTPWRGYAEARTFDLEDVYNRNPSYEAMQQDNPLVWGMGCALWTDDGVQVHMIDQRLFPRILALAEQMWHKGNSLSFERFLGRVNAKKAWFEKKGYTFGPALKEEVDSCYKWE